jgi:site-specific recombinase XerC
MPRPAINLEPYQDWICDHYQTGSTPDTIAELLASQHGINITSRTIKARLSTWGIQKQNRTATTDKVLHARIKVLIYQVGLNV